MAIIEHDLEEMQSDTLAKEVSLEDYMENYAANHYEWVEGVLVKMSPGELSHNALLYFLHRFLTGYFDLKPIGRVIGQPFVMRLPAFPRRRREPDLLVVLNNNPHELKLTYMTGPADLCIEIVSEESVARDHGEKFEEYEKGGVGEYWIVDKLRHEARFYRPDNRGIYIPHTVDQDGNYRTPALPGFVLHVSLLWEQELPTLVETAEMVKRMLEEDQK